MEHHKTIELELRAEVLPQDVVSIKARLEKLGSLHSHTKRLSVMYFGNFEKKKVDIRVRVTNGQSEVVAKFGSFGARDRIEVAQPISPNQFIGFVGMFAQFGFTSKVGERETFNYILPNDIMASLVIAGPTAYIELEKMSESERLEKDTYELHDIAKQLNITLLSSESQFDELCKRLDETVDWQFNGSASDYKRLEESLKQYVE